MEGRRQIDSYPLRFTQTILWSEMDAFRHLNNGSTGRYFEEGRAALNALVFGQHMMVNPSGGIQILFARLEMDFVAQAYYPGSAEVGTGVIHIGASSFRVAQAAFQNGGCFALAEAVLVKAVDGRSAPLSDDERAILARYRLDAR